MMRQVRDKVAFFERQVRNGSDGKGDEEAENGSFAPSLAESTESLRSGDDGITAGERPGKRIFFTQKGSEEKSMGLSSKGTSDIWSMFAGNQMPSITSARQGGRHGVANSTKPANNRFQKPNANNTPSFFSRHSQDIKQQVRPNDVRTSGIPSSGLPPLIAPPLESQGNLQTPPSPTPVRKFSSDKRESVGRPMGSGAGQKRTWGVANGNRGGYVLPPTVESIVLPPPVESAVLAEENPGSSPARKRLNHEQRNLLESVICQSHDPEIAIDDSTLPRPAPAKGTPEAKLQYAKKMQAGYLRSTAKGPFVPKPPNRWGPA